MSNKSEKLNKPFSKALWNKAKKIADKYEIIVSFEDGEWYGKGVEMPTVFGGGKTVERCVKNTKEALTAVVAHLLEQHERIPTPASEGTRETQVNIRLNAEEKALLAASAQSQGFPTLAAFIRTTALRQRPA